MATDVTGGPVVTNASPFAVPADLTALKNHFGDASKFKVASAASLPASSWVGHTLHVEDVDVLVQWTGSAWKRWYPTHAMAQGSVVCPAGGAGGATSGGIGWSALINVTFPVGRFSTAPQVKVQTVGPNDQVSLGGVVEQVTTSGCKVRGVRVGSVPNELFTVQWTAIQMTSGSAVG